MHPFSNIEVGKCNHTRSASTPAQGHRIGSALGVRSSYTASQLKFYASTAVAKKIHLLIT